MESAKNRSTREKGDQAEIRVIHHLKRIGFRSLRMNRLNGPYDLLVDGRPVEVKYALPSKTGTWQFNIQRHGKMPSFMPSAYILCMDGVPYCKNWIYLVLPSSEATPVIHTSYRSLLGKHHRYVENWGLLHDGSYPLKPTFVCNELVENKIVRLVSLKAKDFSTYAKARVFWSGLELADFADSIGISVEDVQDVIDGNLSPSRDALIALGIEEFVDHSNGESKHVA